MDVASKFLRKQTIQISEESNDIDRLLLESSQNKPDTAEALLCLRCRVSHPIVEKVREIFSQHAEKLELEDMLTYVLDDTGDVENGLPIIKFQETTTQGTVQTLVKPLSWNTLLELSKSQIKPFGAEIIYGFDPRLSNLSTWAKNKVRGNASLKSYLRNCGVLLQSTWSLIANSSTTRIKESWRLHGPGSMTVEDMVRLHSSYVGQYKRAKQAYKSSTGKISGWQPDDEFLFSLNPSQVNIDNLEELGQAIRKYLFPLQSNKKEFKEEEYSPSNDNDFLKEDLIKAIHQVLKRSTEPIVKAAINADRSRWSKDPSRELAWQLYGQGLSQRDIATSCNHKQGWVSKLLLEKTLSEQIAQEAAIDLIKRSEFKPLLQDPAGVDRMIEALQNYLVSSEQEGKISLLRQGVDEALNS